MSGCAFVFFSVNCLCCSCDFIPVENGHSWSLEHVEVRPVWDQQLGKGTIASHPILLRLSTCLHCEGCKIQKSVCPLLNSTHRMAPFVPGHALHERVYRNKKGVCPLVGSHERRALLVPVINRLSTADFVPAFGLHRILLVRASGETFKRFVFDALGGTRDACLLGELFCRGPVLTDPAPPPRRAPRPDPPVVCLGFGFDRFCKSNAPFVISSVCIEFRMFVLLGERSGHLFSMRWEIGACVVTLTKCVFWVPFCMPSSLGVRRLDMRPLWDVQGFCFVSCV